MRQAVSLVAPLFAFAIWSTSLKAGLIFQHSGNTDPTTTGWTFVPGTFAPTVGAVTNDLGLGIDAWLVDDSSTAGGSFGSYVQLPSAAQVTDAGTLGWTLRTRLRVVDVPDGLDFGVYFEYRDGVNEWDVIFGAQADGDPIVRLSTGPNVGPEFILEGSGGGYHLYELVYDPLSDSADLFVDSVERISNYTGRTGGLSKQVAWGAGQSDQTGQGNWSLVEWEINDVPEPSSLALCSLGASFVAVRGYNRRRKMRGNYRRFQGLRRLLRQS